MNTSHRPIDRRRLLLLAGIAVTTVLGVASCLRAISYLAHVPIELDYAQFYNLRTGVSLEGH